MFTLRASALEDEFFRRVDQELIHKLRQREETEKGRQRLQEVTGIAERPVLDELLGAGIHAETLVALTLVPLVQVAWADRSMHSAERQAILESCEAAGVVKGTPSHQVLTDWLRKKPGVGLFVAWKNYIAELRKVLEPERYRQLRQDITQRARDIAEEAGGILGIGRVSDAEDAVLEEVARALDG